MDAPDVLELSLKFDLRAPSWGTPPTELYAAAIAMCDWADAVGFDVVRFLEHHGSEDGYCPSPLIMAGAVAARTRRVRIRARALILPLHDPIRVAEDTAVIDLISQGRLELVIGAGYVPSEFAMFGRTLADRPRLVEAGVEALKQAWTGEPFTYEGRPVRVALRPHRRPRPPIALGGSSAAAARRAARIADGFEPTNPALFDEYLAECLRLGVEPGPRPPTLPPHRFLHVADDPESAWAALGPHLLHEMRSYGAWTAAAGTSVGYRPVEDLDELRATGSYMIVTPEECISMAESLGPRGAIELHPLVGGADPSIGWSCLNLVERDVMPALRKAGLTT